MTSSSMKDGAMASAVDGLKQRFMDMSQPDDAGIYRNGSAKRKARTELAMQCLTELWQEACKGVSFSVPDSGIGFASVGSLAPARTLTWSSSMSPAPSTTSNSMNWPINFGTPCGIAAWTSTIRFAPAPSARRSLIMTCPPPWGGLMSNLSPEIRN